MNNADQIRQMRRELGRELRARRMAVKLSQSELARLTGKSRSAISTLESFPGSAMSRTFWQRCDEVLGTRGIFVRRWDVIQQQVDAARAAAAEARRQESGRALGSTGQTPLQALRELRPDADVSAARDVYRQLRWPLAEREASLELVTGKVADALEVARPAGLLAIQWWRDSQGAADLVRGMPALPLPGQALATITVGQRCFFLVRPGRCPWPDAPVTGVCRSADASVIGWHAAGGAVPLPPGRPVNGEHAEWAELPSRSLRLASPFAVLDLLAKAVTVIRHNCGALALAGGVLVMPRKADRWTVLSPACSTAGRQAEPITIGTCCPIRQRYAST